MIEEKMGAGMSHLQEMLLDQCNLSLSHPELSVVYWQVAWSRSQLDTLQMWSCRELLIAWPLHVSHSEHLDRPLGERPQLVLWLALIHTFARYLRPAYTENLCCQLQRLRTLSLVCCWSCYDYLFDLKSFSFRKERSSPLCQPDFCIIPYLGIQEASLMLLLLGVDTHN